MSHDALLSEEMVREGDALVGASLAVDRALRLWPQLRSEPHLRALTLRCDLGGNDVELADLTAEIVAHGLPPALRRLEIDRRGHYEDRDDDTLELDEATARLSLEVDDTTDAALVLAALTVMLARAPALATIDLGGNNKGRNDLDAALAVMIAAGPWPHLQALSLSCTRRHERDYVQWIATRTLADLLARCPSLTTLSLPRAELWLEVLHHATLRELELGWLGCAPLGPTDSREWGRAPTPRGAGLEFLREARLPALERLAIDFQFDWYVGWQIADLAALCAATGMPRLTQLELRYCDLGDALVRRLPGAPWARQLERLDLTGTDFDGETAAALVTARPRFGRLRELWCFRPDDVDDASWQALCAAYVVRTPD